MQKGAAVLLVDDDTELRECVKEELEESGFMVRAVGDGREALEALRAWLPDLIVLDLNMPVIDGWEFRVRQRGDARLATIPLLAMSADPSPKAAAMDADGFLRKPFSTIQLLSRIGEILSSARKDRLQSAMAAGSAAGLLHQVNNALSILLGGLELVAIGVGDLTPEPIGVREGDGGRAAALAVIQSDVEVSRAAAQQLRELTDDLEALGRSADEEGPTSSQSSPPLAGSSHRH
jgi:CheY-like chemotaxis protein